MQWTELIFRALSDVPAPVAAPLFLFGQTADNEASVLDRAAHCVRDGRASEVWFIDSAPLSGYPGAVAWRKALQTRGLTLAQCQPLPIEPTPLLHTRLEAEAAIAWALRQHCRHLTVCATALHQPRALATAISVALAQYPALRLYSLPGYPLAWDAAAAHSQGTLYGTRADLIAGELERLDRYQTKGDLATVAEVMAYLRRRDA